MFHLKITYHIHIAQNIYKNTMTIFTKMYLQCVYWNRGHPDNENQSEGRTETIDSNIFKSSQSNAQYKTMKSQLVHWPVLFTRLQCRLMTSSNQ